MISKEHQQKVLQMLAEKERQRRQHRRAIRSIENDMAEVLRLARKHRATWSEIGRAMNMHSASASKFYRRWSDRSWQDV